ncbi:hypothetical protein FGRMN_2217 [Fusarium graminum]|nr:hypothetical protein FGRMN_2217 [Fusarium graminum]
MELISFFLQVAALALLAAIPTAHASTAIIVPWNMTAGQVYDIKIDQRIEPDSEIRKRANAYRVFLALTPPGWGTGPVCWLEYMVDLDTTQVNITIPPDVAPDKSRIRLSTALYKKGDKRTQGFSYSSTSLLLGGNGTWSQRELDGWVIADDEEISCWALACARSCQNQYYTGDKTRYSDEKGDGKATACVNQCAKDVDPRYSGAVNAITMPSVLVVGVVAGFVHMIAGGFS